MVFFLGINRWNSDWLPGIGPFRINMEIFRHWSVTNFIQKKKYSQEQSLKQTTFSETILVQMEVMKIQHVR